MSLNWPRNWKIACKMWDKTKIKLQVNKAWQILACTIQLHLDLRSRCTGFVQSSNLPGFINLSFNFTILLILNSKLWKSINEYWNSINEIAEVNKWYMEVRKWIIWRSIKNLELHNFSLLAFHTIRDFNVWYHTKQFMCKMINIVPLCRVGLNSQFDFISKWVTYIFKYH